MTRGMAPLERLQQFLEQGELETADLMFARFFHEALDENCPEILALAAFVSRSARQEHSCALLDDFSQSRLAEGSRQKIEELLARSQQIGPTLRTPLVQEGQRIYLQRLYIQETTIADLLLERACDLPVDEQLLVQSAARLFRWRSKSGWSTEGAADPDWQQLSAIMATTRQVFILGGGPGTGKTTTVAWFLALKLLLHPEAELRIGLAAPTGKAAARLSAALNVTLSARLEEDPGLLPERLRARLPKEARTLHRLLGARPFSTEYHYSSDRPLPLDLLVVDEASMLNQALMRHLLLALPKQCQLVLLGDPAQLPSVGPGQVLRDILQPLTGTADTRLPLTDAGKKRLERITGQPLQQFSRKSDAGLADSVSLLRVTHRYAPESLLARAIDAVGQGRPPPNATDNSFRSLPVWSTEAPVPDALLEPFRDFLRKGSRSPLDWLEAFDTFRLLTPVHEGPYGSAHLNLMIARQLGRRDVWYHGRPVLINTNDYSLRLLNGDVGITLCDSSGVRVCFRGEGQTLVEVRPERLPAHETCFAMTVHKSQGSEFRTVALLVPGKLSKQQEELITRQLLYTGMSRARERLLLYADDDMMKLALQRDSARVTGLHRRLWSRDAREGC